MPGHDDSECCCRALAERRPRGSIALALTGRVWVGLCVIALGIVVPRLIKRSAPQFLLAQALHDEKLYLELAQSGIIAVDV